MERCQWVTDQARYIAYHDEEWGRPTRDDRELFELLCLEGAQAGLSWWNILKRRDAYREAFDQFDPAKIRQYDETKIEQLLANEGIIRNRLKIESVIKNAKAYERVTERCGSFSAYIWQFVENQPIQNAWEHPEEVPATTELSTRMSKQMKKDGFSFVGPTICYAYMQSTGLVNDHLTRCWCYEPVKALSE
ncbi:DNA-3-methyladenine glycosylase I [Dolosigranulum pigrum]|uniref:DNA-3-methyladenine glycosylase I n=1 Tax=Dolosigranulum pigrum TaxID=29394 RepID=UPI00370D1A8D